MNDATMTTTRDAQPAPAFPAAPASRAIYRPDVDIRETERELLLVADVPGATADAIDVHCEKGTLTITARVAPREATGRRWLLREYGVGDYRRSFELDERVDVARISGEFADGVLTLHLPKVESAQPRRIAIRSA